MEHVTHLTQPDEALRRARTITSDRDQRTRDGLTTIATQLARTRPTEPMTETDRVRAARVYALDNHRTTRIASGVLWDLCDTLPPVREGETRGEYAARIQLHLQRVQA